MIAELEERLNRLEDDREILHTLYSYGHCIDYGDENGFVDCFLPDGVLHWPLGPVHGHSDIRAAFRRHTHAPDVYHKHFIAEPLIISDGMRANVMCMYTRLDSYADGPAISSFGRYLDVLLRCPDGRWRFEERVAEVESRRTVPS
jgi:ketosteroid isomerase-like protein